MNLKPANKSYRIDETYLKVKGEDKYLYRALDSTGQTTNFLLTAKRFLLRAIEASGNSMPRVINVDKNPAYPAAMEALKADGAILALTMRIRRSRWRDRSAPLGTMSSIQMPAESGAYHAI